MIARKSDHAAHLIHVQSESQHDRVSDIARIGWPGRDRGVGRILMSAEIIRFTSRIYYTHFGQIDRDNSGYIRQLSDAFSASA